MSKPLIAQGRTAEIYAGEPGKILKVYRAGFHPGNIISPGKRDLAIDWMDCSIGHPVANVARTFILLLGMSATIGTLPFLSAHRRRPPGKGDYQITSMAADASVSGAKRVNPNAMRCAPFSANLKT